MTAQALPDLHDALRAISALQRHATMLNAMADAADSLFEDMPERAPSRHGNGLNAVLAAVTEQSQSLANDLNKLEDALRAAVQGGAA